MKKSSLMGASVVAAALLAAAPVVAPVASLATPGTQVVKAANPTAAQAREDTVNLIQQQATGTRLVDNTNDNNHGEVGQFGNALKNNIKFLTSTKFSTPTNPVKIGSTTDNSVFKATSDAAGYSLQLGNGTSDGVTGENVHPENLLNYFFNGNNTVNLQNVYNYNAASDMYYTLRFDYSNAINNKQYQIIGTGSNDGSKVARDLATMGGTVTMTMTLRDSVGTSLGEVKSTVSYNNAKISAAYVSYNKNLNASVGDSANQFKLVNSFQNAGGAIKDQNGNDILQTIVDNGGVYANAVRQLNENTGGAANNPVGDVFTDQGTYYQHISLNLRAGRVQVPGNDWAAAVRNGLITVNGETPSLTNVDADAYMVTATDGTNIDGQHYGNGTLVLKRTINVGQAQGNFKTDKINGKVTVNMNDGMAAQVYDENGKQVLGRALPNKSAWKTVEKRTYYKDGQVFYQVSTNEYVKAQDVVFTEYSSSSNDNDPLSGKVNVTKYPSKVINILNDGYAAGVYAINEDGQGMHQVIGRFLPSGSAWINQGTAEVNGNLFYQVSTNEWVSANSVAK